MRNASKPLLRREHKSALRSGWLGKKVIFADEFSFRFVVVNRMWYYMTGDKQEVVGIFKSGSICCSRAGELHWTPSSAWSFRPLHVCVERFLLHRLRTKEDQGVLIFKDLPAQSLHLSSLKHLQRHVKPQNEFCKLMCLCAKEKQKPHFCCNPWTSFGDWILLKCIKQITDFGIHDVYLY